MIPSAPMTVGTLSLGPGKGVRLRTLLLGLLWIAGGPGGVAYAGPAPADLELRYLHGSTRRLGQLVGDRDLSTGAQTPTQSQSRFGIVGTDLGYPFEHRGKIWFLFGDTIGRDRKSDVIGVLDTRHGDDPMRLDFLTGPDGRYLTISPRGVDMGPFNVPVAGIDLDGTAYVIVKTGNGGRGSETMRAVLTRYDDQAQTFTVLREISRRPAGKFLTVAMHEQTGPVQGLPDGGPWVYVWGTGQFRHSDGYLAIVPARAFATGEGTLYYAGLRENGTPIWSPDAAASRPVVDHPTMGDLSVTWVQDLGLWLMVYDSRNPIGILARTATAPWGPWSAASTIVTPKDAVGKLLHVPGRGDHLAWPGAREWGSSREGDRGAPYAPYVVERFTRVNGDKLKIYYLLSTWNPYVVLAMTSEFSVEQ